MTFDDATYESLACASREMHFACSASGEVLHADQRASRMLGLERGASLTSLVAPGCELKLQDFLRAAAQENVRDFEVPFVARGKALTVSLCSEPRPGAIIVIGHLIPEAFVNAMDHVNGMVSEVVDLNRKLTRVNSELKDSNQGILTLHRELQQRADQTRQENEIKTRLVSNLSHELRTPLHSILGLSQLLMSGSDGPLHPEQEKQVRFIKASADDLLTLINDVLDLGRLDAGQAQLHIDKFDLEDFVASMRGVLRPLVPEGSPVQLEVEDAPTNQIIESDRTKVSQIVRNLVSNALKFTETGEVRLRTSVAGDRLVIRVTDTGVGIAPEHHAKIFEEYGQIDSPVQRRVKGTGLGLPLSRRLAERLGGTLTLQSSEGKGSTFTLDIPTRHDEAAAMNAIVERSRNKPPGAASILVVEDDRQSLFLYEKYLVMAGFHVLPARSIEEAKARLQEHRPAAIVLDVMLDGESSWGFLAHLKNDPETQDIPVLVVTVTDRSDKARALGADEFWLKPVNQDRLLRKLKELAMKTPVTRVLVIDDDDTARYIIQRHLDGTNYAVYEAATGEDGVRIAREQHPHVILLDFLLKGSTAFDVIDELKADARTRGIPIIVITSQVLDTIDQRRLLQEAEAVISKQNLSRELAINRIRDALRKVGGHHGE